MPDTMPKDYARQVSLGSLHHLTFGHQAWRGGTLGQRALHLGAAALSRHEVAT